MFEKTLREMSEMERQLLIDAASGTKISLIQLFILLAGIPLAGLMLGALAGVLLDWLNLDLSAMFLLIAGAVGGLCLAMYFTWKEISSVRRNRSLYKRDLGEGRVEVFHCEPEAAVQVEQYEDEGPGFFLKVAPGKLLFLQGQYLEEQMDNQSFPNSRFDVIRALHSAFVFGLECHGQPLAPMRTRRWLSDKEYEPSDQEVIDGNLESLEADLVRLRASHRKGRH